MFPGVGGMNPKQMAKMMAQMGIKTEELDSSKVTIELKDGTRLVVFEPSVMQIEIQGQRSFQVSGKVQEEKDAAEEDIKLVMEQAGCSREEAINALRETGGDIAEAILRLKNE
ncbi:MAG: nascent polypeptide-associated complex protein [Candidatus Micrarchaeota archaeon]|nr:nascent polypeptide-associated complex protein [Candidatus Micrarchaeota archaeon]